MAEPRIRLYPSTPLGLRLFDWIPLPPVAVGVCIGLAVFGLFLLYTWAFGVRVGQLAGTPEPALFAELIQDLFIGFALAVSAISIRGALGDLDALAPLLRDDAEQRERLRREIMTYRPGVLVLVGLAVGGIVALFVLSEPWWEGGGSAAWSHPTTLWYLGRNFVNWWVVSRAGALELMLGSSFSRVGDHLASVDLLDRTPLAPFGRRALRNVLLWMLLTAFMSLVYTPAGGAASYAFVGVLSLATFAVAAFLLPLLGAHRRIRGFKNAELEKVRIAIHETRERVIRAGASGDLSGGRLSDLVAYEARIAAVPEWPLDASMLLRFGLYLAIGLGSWVGAALVERALDTALQ